MGKIKKFMNSPVTWKQVAIMSAVSALITGIAYIFLCADIWGSYLKDHMKPKKKKR